MPTPTYLYILPFLLAGPDNWLHPIIPFYLNPHTTYFTKEGKHCQKDPNTELATSAKNLSPPALTELFHLINGCFLSTT